MSDRLESPLPRLNRRRMLKTTAGALATAGLVLTAAETHSRMNAHRPGTLGFTFSAWQCDILDLPVIPALRQLISLEPDVIRFGSHWDNIESEKGKYNFKSLEDQLNEISKAHNKISVILTVGMKAPRYPEFFFPKWIRENPDINTQQTDKPLDSNSILAGAATDFVLKTLEFAQQFPFIEYHQYENEPWLRNKLSVTRGRYLSEAYVSNLIREGRKITDSTGQKTLLTYSLSPMPFLTDEPARKLMANSNMADSAGKNLYINAPDYLPGAASVVLQNANLQRLYLNMVGVEDWVTECQAEPWERNGILPLRTEYPSASPESAYDLARLLGGRGHERVLMWGAEFWEKQRQIGNPRWMQKMDQLFQAA